MLDSTISTPANASAESARIGWLSPRNITVLPALRCRREEPDRGDREIALLEQADHPLSHGPTGTHDRDVLHDPPPGRYWPESRQAGIPIGQIPRADPTDPRVYIIDRRLPRIPARNVDVSALRQLPSHAARPA